MTKRIAMWSGPRNLSTALMYSFASRSDCDVADEPFYAAYLQHSGVDHPMKPEVLASQSSDAEMVVKALTAPVSKPVFYQKHMAHHMLPTFPMGWIESMQNVFLIRHPHRVVASYAKKREAPNLDDLGFRQQARIFEMVDGGLVVDASDIRADPERVLSALCHRLGISWDAAMLSWPKGGHRADGVWAKHWYGAIHQSSGFAGPEGPMPELKGDYFALAQAAMPYYEALAASKIT